MAVDPLVCLSTGALILNTLLLANLSLHCLICFHSFDFGSNITNIGPEPHSMPINHSDILSNVSACKGLDRKSAWVSSVGQCSTSNSCFSERSVMQKHLMLRCRVLEHMNCRKSLEHVEKIEHVEMTNGQNHMKKQWRRSEQSQHLQQRKQ